MMLTVFSIEFMRYFLHGLFLLAGCFSLLCALMNWDWFFKSPNAQIIVKPLGRKNARFFYGIVGLVLIIIGAAAFF